MPKTDVDQYFDEQMQSLDYRANYALIELAEKLAPQIKRAREAKDLTQTQLAELLGVRQSLVSKWEDPFYGTYTLLTLAKLSDVLDCQLQVSIVPNASAAKAAAMSQQQQIVGYGGNVVQFESRQPNYQIAPSKAIPA